MDYLHRNHHIRTDPRNLLQGARSVIVTASSYHRSAPEIQNDAQARGRVAMYAWGDDYHEVVKNRLHKLVDVMRERIDEEFEARSCVDTVPILERELAAMAGVGWIGKNTMVLNRELGSYFFLGEIVTTLELACDEPVADHCGSCTRCLDACPTAALSTPYEMDASKCISYLTIEHRGEIPEQYHKDMGDWIFGCDICQEVCPYNRDAAVSENSPIREPGPRPILAEIAAWSQGDYRRTLKGSTMKRAKLSMLKRNVAIAARNASA